MSASKDLLDDQDPDYTCPVSTDKKEEEVCEENARATTRKITAIIEREFSLEIESKKNEILQIQERLHKALKTIHLLRYVIITDFYNRKQCQASQTCDKQVRIHPAIKRLIGKAPKRSWDDTAMASTSAGSPQCKSHYSLENEVKNMKQVEESFKTNEKFFKNEFEQNDSVTEKCADDDESKPKKIPRYVPPKSGLPEVPFPSRGIRHKVRKRIVIGNISKWIPPDWREDAASHKWTVYVRGPKEASNIDDFVNKVRFFLHPSYRPNDVVEISTPPFHLSRRGWGEFPLRVQLHFKNPINKPMDVIHHLKLDRTYTGLQTLGSETVVDVWIYMSGPRSFQQDVTNDSSENLETNDEKGFNTISINTREEKESSSKELTVAAVKQEPSDIAIYEINSIDSKENSSSTDSHIIYYSTSNNDTANNVRKCGNLSDNSELTMKQMKFHIRHDHNYLGDNYTDANNFGVERNITIEHKNEEDSAEENKCANNKQILSTNPSKNSSLLLDSKFTLPPLQISIPPMFETRTGKRMLILRNNKKNEISNTECTKIAHKGDTYNNLNNSKSSIFIPGGTSLLKRSLLKTSNSVLIDLNSDIPALQIADGYSDCTSFNHAAYQPKEKSVFEAAAAVEENGKATKSRVIVGKDKFKIHSKQGEYEEILRSIDEVRISDIEGTIRFIIRRLPIVTPFASDPDYKRLHPYACSNEEEFLSYNPGKRASYEWYRAKTIRESLKKKTFAKNSIWSVKEILIWARLHGYTPVRSSFLLDPSNTVNGAKRLSCSDISTCTEPVEFHRWMEGCQRMSRDPSTRELEEDSQEEEIDIVTVKKSEASLVTSIKREKCNKKQMETCKSIFLEIEEKSIPLHTFVCDTARSIGVKLLPQEILPNVMHFTASRLLTRATECLVEDLLRKSLAKAWQRSNGKELPQLVSLDDVRAAITSREEFDVFTNEGLGSRFHPTSMD